MTKRALLIKSAVWGIFCLTALVIYANSFQAPFQFDSIPKVKNNPAVRIDTLSWNSLVEAAFGKESARNRPLGNVTFALNYYFHGEDPFGYHVVNVFIHVFSGFFLFLFLLRAFRLANPGKNDGTALLVSFSAALLWLVHPVNTQSVTYIVQRLNSLAAMFFLLAFWLYAEGRTRDRQWPWFAGAVLSWLLALGSKQNTAVLPFLIFLYEWFFFQKLSRTWLKQNIKYLLIPIALFGFAALVYLGGDPVKRLSSFRDFADGRFSFSQRLLTQPRVIVYYLSLFFFPHPSRLNIDHDFPLSDSLIAPITTLLSLLGIVALLAAAIVLARRRPLISFCILWFFGTLAVESTIVPLAIIFEHRTYLPFTMLSFSAALMIFEAVRLNRLAVFLVAAPAIVFGAWTYQRNQVYQDGFTLWSDVLEKAPENARAYSNLGLEIEKKEGMEAAEAYYEAAIQRDPSRYEALNNLGHLRFRQGRYEEALRFFEQTLEAQPRFVPALNGKGSTYQALGRIREAIDAFRTALLLEPNNVEAEKELGSALMRLGRIEEALRHLKRAVEIDSDFVDARINLAAVQMQQNDLAGARFHLQRALEIDPTHPNAHNNLGTLLINTGDPERAEKHFRKALQTDSGFDPARENLEQILAMTEDPLAKADKVKEELRLDPQNPVLFWELGRLYAGAGRLKDSLKMFESALGADNAFVPALNDAAALYAYTGREAEALKHLETIVKIDPGRADAYYNGACMLARSGKPKEAVAWLKTAIEKGYSQWERIAADPDLETIRETEAYKGLMKRRPQ